MNCQKVVFKTQDLTGTLRVKTNSDTRLGIHIQAFEINPIALIMSKTLF